MIERLPEYARPMRYFEAALGLLVIGALTYFAYAAAGDEFPLNVAIAALALVLAAGLVLRSSGRKPP